MSKGLTIEGSFLLGTFISIFMYGIYVCLFVVAMSRMRRSRMKSHVVPVVICVLFVLTTASIALQIADIFEAFIDHAENVKGYFAVRSKRILAGAIDTFLFFNLSLGDSFITWRLYMIWNQNRHVLWFPCALAVASAVCSTVCVSLELRMMVVQDPNFINPVYTWSLASICLSLFLTVIVTSLICFRLLRVSRNVASIRENDGFYTKLVWVLVESGSLYSATLLLWALCVVTKQTKVTISSSYLLTVVPGIVPTLIMIRLHSIQHPTVTEATLPSMHYGDSSSGITVSKTIEISTVYSPKRVSTHPVSQFTINDETDADEEQRSVKKSRSFADSV